MKINYFKRVNNMKSIETIKFCVSSSTNLWIHMNRIYSFSVRMFFHYSANRPKHLMHRSTQIFSTMRSD